MNLALLLASAAFLHVLIFVGITEFFAISTTDAEDVDAASRFISLFIVGLGQATGLALLVRSSTSRGLSLLASLAVLYGGVVVLLPAADEWLLVPLAEPEAVTELGLLVRTVQAVIWLPVSTWLLLPVGEPRPYSGSDLPGLAWLRALLLGGVYLGASFLTAELLALRAPGAARWFVSLDSEPMLWAIFAGRGVMLGLMCWPVVVGLRGPGIVRGTVLGLALASLVASPWVLAHPEVSDAARWPIAVGQAAIAGVFGLFVALAYVKRRPELPSAPGTSPRAGVSRT